MLKYDDISPAMRAFMGGWEAFRKLGFKADDLHCLVCRSGRRGGVLACFVHLKAQGKEFHMEVADVTVDQATWDAEYKRVVEAMNSGQVVQEDMDRIWQESEAFRNPTGFMTAVLMKGLVPPKSRS